MRTQLGIRATSPARTVLDCAPRLAKAKVTRTINDALHTPYLTEDQLADVIARHPGHPGAKLVEMVLYGDRTRSGWEDDFPGFCERFGLPRPRMDTKVCGYEVDAYFAEHRLIIELDGYEFHRDRQAFEDDRNRDAEMLAAGIATVRVTWERLKLAPRPSAKRLLTILAQRRRRPRSVA